MKLLKIPTRCRGALAILLLSMLLSTLISNTAFAEDHDDSAKVNVAHFAPFADNVANTSVTVKVTGEGVDETLENVLFGQIAKGLELPSDVELTVQIFPSGATDPALEGVYTLEEDDHYTIAAIGGANGWSLALLPLEDESVEDADDVPTNGALVRIGHLAPFASAPADTAVDICTDSGTAILAGVEYSAVTDYLPLDAGVYDLLIALAGSDCQTVALDLPAFVLANGDIVDLFAIGLLPDDANFPLQIASTTGITPVPGPGMAKVNVAHFAPFADSVAATSVTVKVTGEGVDEMLENVLFGQIAKGLQLPSDVELTVQVFRTDTTDPVLEEKYTLVDGSSYTIAAIGGANGWTLELLPLVNETVAPADGALVRIGHLAPFADAGVAGSTAVDICTDSGTAVLPGVEYLAVTDYLPFDDGVYDLLIALAGTGCQTVAIDLPAFELTDGDIVDLFAIGLLPDNAEFPLQIASTAGVTPVTVAGTATVNVAHFAPFADNVANTSVTVKVTGEGVDEMLENVLFGQIAKGLELPSDVELTVQIIRTGTTVPVLEEKYMLVDGSSQTIAAIGGANGWALELLPLPDQTVPPANGALVRIGHLAPFADATVAGSTSVDICTDTGIAIQMGVEYRTVTNYLPFEVGVYDLLIALAGTGCQTVALDLPAFVLGEGDIIDAFAIGLQPGDANFPLQMAGAERLQVEFRWYLPSIFGGP